MARRNAPSLQLCPAYTALVFAGNVLAGACESKDVETKVSGNRECIVIRRYGDVSIAPKAMLVWLHGDLSSGDPANYHFQIAANAARQFSANQVLSFALVRPGYADGSRHSSGGNRYGRSDLYTMDNVGEVGAAIEHLRQHYKPDRVIIIGHSGGAATAAILLGMEPVLADGVLLVSCPCDLAAWRIGRRPWSRSEEPMRWAGKARPSTKVIAVTGSRDDNTSPALAKAFYRARQCGPRRRSVRDRGRRDS